MLKLKRLFWREAPNKQEATQEEKVLAEEKLKSSLTSDAEREFFGFKTQIEFTDDNAEIEVETSADYTFQKEFEESLQESVKAGLVDQTWVDNLLNKENNPTSKEENNESTKNR